MLKEKRFHPKGCEVKEFVLREVHGIDERQAAMLSEAQGPKSSAYEELIRLSIIEVDGERVMQPFAAMDKWGARLRKFLLRAYQSMNDVSDEELGDFLLEAEIVSNVVEKLETPQKEQLRKV